MHKAFLLLFVASPYLGRRQRCGFIAINKTFYYKNLIGKSFPETFKALIFTAFYCFCTAFFPSFVLFCLSLYYYLHSDFHQISLPYSQRKSKDPNYHTTVFGRVWVFTHDGAKRQVFIIFGESQSVSVVLHREIISRPVFLPCFSGLYDKREAFFKFYPSATVSSPFAGSYVITCQCLRSELSNISEYQGARALGTIYITSCFFNSSNAR